MKTGIELIAEERKEQIEKHNHTPEDDKQYNHAGDLVQGAIAVLNHGPFPKHWDPNVCNRMVCKNITERLAIAGALIAAEIDRYQSV